MAKRFTFKLATLLKVRQAEEDRHKRIVAKRVQHMHALQTQRRELQASIAQGLEQSAATASSERVDVALLSKQRYWVGHLHGCTLATEARLREAEGHLDQERQALTQAALAVRVVEKLKERQQRRHDDAINRAERRADDELSILRFSYLKTQARHDA